MQLSVEHNTSVQNCTMPGACNLLCAIFENEPEIVTSWRNINYDVIILTAKQQRRRVSVSARKSIAEECI